MLAEKQCKIPNSEDIEAAIVPEKLVQHTNRLLELTTNAQKHICCTKRKHVEREVNQVTRKTKDVVESVGSVAQNNRREFENRFDSDADRDLRSLFANHGLDTCKKLVGEYYEQARSNQELLNDKRKQMKTNFEKSNQVYQTHFKRLQDVGRKLLAFLRRKAIRRAGGWSVNANYDVCVDEIKYIIAQQICLAAQYVCDRLSIHYESFETIQGKVEMTAAPIDVARSAGLLLDTVLPRSEDSRSILANLFTAEKLEILVRTIIQKVNVDNFENVIDEEIDYAISKIQIPETVIAYLNMLPTRRKILNHCIDASMPWVPINDKMDPGKNRARLKLVSIQGGSTEQKISKALANAGHIGGQTRVVDIDDTTRITVATEERYLALPEIKEWEIAQRETCNVLEERFLASITVLADESMVRNYRPNPYDARKTQRVFILALALGLIVRDGDHTYRAGNSAIAAKLPGLHDDRIEKGYDSTIMRLRVDHGLTLALSKLIEEQLENMGTKQACDALLKMFRDTSIIPKAYLRQTHEILTEEIESRGCVVPSTSDLPEQSSPKLVEVVATGI